MHKGWFIIPGVQEGDRTASQQLLGLETIAKQFKGATVLDLGCAEGLIGRHCIDAWDAASVDGVTRIQYEIDEAHKQCKGRPMRFLCGDLGSQAERAALPLLPKYDIVLALSVLHKVKKPMELLEWACGFVGRYLVVRLPDPTIIHERQLYEPQPVREWLVKRYALASEPKTCMEPVTRKPEWMGIFRAD
jgi:trans-aconitate methyltransferase